MKISPPLETNLVRWSLGAAPPTGLDVTHSHRRLASGVFIGPPDGDSGEPRVAHLSHVPVPAEHEGVWEGNHISQDPLQSALSEVRNLKLG